LVPEGRLELPHPKAADFESAASTNSATRAQPIHPLKDKPNA
jgi:hypothetical protein